jgi:fermentation-respiration switch protein FrsA (DUF1100 family)
LLAPYESLKVLVSELPFFGFLNHFVWYDFNTSEYISKLKSSCLILAHGKNDRTIPIHHSNKIYKEASLRRKMIKVNNTGHNDLFSNVHIALKDEIIACLEQDRE